MACPRATGKSYGYSIRLGCVAMLAAHAHARALCGHAIRGLAKMQQNRCTPANSGVTSSHARSTAAHVPLGAARDGSGWLGMARDGSGWLRGRWDGTRRSVEYVRVSKVKPNPRYSRSRARQAVAPGIFFCSGCTRLLRRHVHGVAARALRRQENDEAARARRERGACAGRGLRNALVQAAQFGTP